MDLSALISVIQQQRLKDSNDALKNIASSEKYLQQAYEGRYIFELIQNVRDANKETDSEGAVFIELKERSLIISNTGTPFTERGVRSITTIGDSPKESQGFIGFKGIGFKSINEISDTPRIVTQWGTIIFDRNKTKELLADRGFKDRDIPLFFIPHFEAVYLSEAEITGGIVTKVILPLNAKTDPAKIKESFQQIGIHQILLLGNLSQIEFKSPEINHRFIISYEAGNRIKILYNDRPYFFRLFKPSGKISIPASVIETLEEKERDIFEKEPFVDISLLFDLDENRRLLPHPHSKLYLFYPTETTSGFPFIIHSYFLVSPDRKALRNSAFNQFILDKIADFIAGDWLTLAKRAGIRFLDFLAFTENPDSPILRYLHDPLVNALADKKFLYAKHTGRYHAINEVFIADGFDKGLFPDNQLNGKELIYIENKQTRDWLIAKFEVDYLTFETIAENIEKECIRQKKRKNWKFFEILYKYVVENDDLNLTGKKVLLTSNFELFSSEDYVFYGLKDKIQFPATINKRIHFIHPMIKISDQRQGKGQTGFVEYNTELLVRRLLRLYEEKGVQESDILDTLLKLNITERLASEIKSRILLPLKNGNWVNPVNTPVYLESAQLADLYPAESFVDLTKINRAALSDLALQQKLKLFGAWSIPAIYYKDKATTFGQSDDRFKYIHGNIRNYTTPYYELHGDWFFHVPVNISTWYTYSILENWKIYCDRITEEGNNQIYYKSQNSDWHPMGRQHWVRLSSVLHYLKDSAWIKIASHDEPLKIRQVVGIDPIEANQSNGAILKKYLYTLELHFSPNEDLIHLLRLSHVDGRSFSNFKQILSAVHAKYKHLKSIDKDFLQFFGKILSKLYDYYYLSGDTQGLSVLQDCPWLGVNEITQCFEWKSAKEIYFIADRPAYEILPEDIKAIIQPHFTNHDKNRFGQISRRIGLNFKQTLIQELTQVNILRSVQVWDFFPSFIEALAFTEAYLDYNLDAKLEEIKKVNIHLCEDFAVELYKDGRHLRKLSDLPYALETDEAVQIYVRYNNTPNPLLYSRIMHDMLVEFLSRDLHKLRWELNDFFGRESKSGFMSKYEISPDRIEELESKIKGISLSRMQSFWHAILRLKNVPDPSSFLDGKEVKFEKIRSALPIDDLGIEQIDYDRLYKLDNLPILQQLFAKLDLTLDRFNEISGFVIDFRDHFNKLVEGLKISYTKNFEVAMHGFLKSRSIEEQSLFQDKTDQYLSLPYAIPAISLLTFDCNTHFFEVVRAVFPDLSLRIEDIDRKKNRLLGIYTTNEQHLKQLAKKLSIETKVINDFLMVNANRSLLYFDGTMSLLEQRLRNQQVQYDQHTAQHSADLKDRLDQYNNTAGTKIENIIPSPLPPKTKTNGSWAHSSGKRIDGSTSNPENDFSGLVAEKAVYQILQKSHPNIEWVSRNAAKAGVNPEGSDQHGCDLRYVDRNGQPQYVEVKSSTTDEKYFFLSFPEYSKAIHEKENYHFYLVLSVLDPPKRRILHLGNIFLLDEDQDLFNNKRFTANFSKLEVRFQ